MASKFTALGRAKSSTKTGRVADPGKDFSDNDEENTGPETDHDSQIDVVRKRTFHNISYNHLHIGSEVAVVIVVLALFWNGQQSTNNRLTKLESTVDKVFKQEKYFDKLDKLEKAVPKLDDDYETVIQKKVKLEKEIQESTTRMEDINSQLERGESKIHEVIRVSEEQREIQDKLKETLEKYKGRLDKVGEVTQNLQTSALKSNSTFEEFQEKFKNLKQTFSESAKLADDVIRTHDELQAKVKNNEDALNNISKDLPGFVEKSGALLEKLITAEQKFEKVKELSDGVHNLERKMTDLDEHGNEMVINTNKLQTTVGNIETKFKAYEKDLSKYKNNLDEATEEQNTLSTDLTNLNRETSAIGQRITEVNGQVTSVKTQLSETENEMNHKMDNINNIISKTDIKVDDLKTEVKHVQEYTDTQVPALKTQLQEVEKTANFPYYCVLDIFEVIAIVIIFISMRDSFFQSSEMIMTGSTGQRSTTNYVRPQSILSRISRAPIMDNKICIVSFYSETSNLHEAMLSAALQNNRRYPIIVQCLVRRHEDILEIPNARYIFIFVDFNERNVILENPGQDLGDKKLITVQAACKLGANVFVTYVRDKGSKTLPPGELYNTELTAFKSHFVLKGLTSNNRCFSVYENYSQSQKEHILESIH